MLDRFSRDELVASLLMLHGLHPVDFDTRVRKAVETLQPALALARRLCRAAEHRGRRRQSAADAQRPRLFRSDGAAADDPVRLLRSRTGPAAAGDRRGDRASSRRGGSALFAAAALCRSWAGRAVPGKDQHTWVTRTKGRRIHPVRARARRSRRDEGKEPGREDTGTTGAGRPAGKSTGRDSSTVAPTDPIDPNSPDMPPA